MSVYYAHSLDGEPPEQWQRIESHLTAVSESSRGFASAFDASQWGLCLGLFHDLGKYNPDFQLYLLNQNGLLPVGMRAPARVDHSTCGARLAYERMGRSVGGLLAYIIAGHHAGLPDYAAEVASGSTVQSSLSGRMKLRADALPGIPTDLPIVAAGDIPAWIKEMKRDTDGAFRVALFTRMLFSCLIDADWLDSEAFREPAKAEKRRSIARPELAEIERRLASYMGRFSESTGPVNERRREVLSACMGRSVDAPGMFSLTVPTGGGKTLASLSFALRHALAHGMRRVIYVIPYTSIIEQTADIFCKAVGDDAVLEHHCNFDPEKRKKNAGEEDKEGDDALRYRFLSDNWDAPIVVTTNVQFYESLFSAHPGRCRKLHNIAQSVIIFDEAQSLPVEYLRPCLQLLRELVHGYGCSTVLCTATQPALDKAEYFSIGFAPEEVRSIVDDPVGLYEALRRVEVVREASPLDTPALVKRLAAPENKRVLCIVNKRKHAAALYEALRGELGPDAGVFHLSALMCPAHRTVVLDEIKRRMADKVALPPCRVISTSLVEAGVDLDFPVVYRALAGVDSIAQAAGRCNREGLMAPAKGRVFVFDPAEKEYAPFGSVNQAAQMAAEAIRLHPDDPLSLACVKSYFEHYYQTRNKNNWDAKDVMGAAKLSASAGLLAQFRLIEKRFRLIDDGQVTIVVPWGEDGDALCKRIRDERFPLDYKDFRKAQRYSVGIPQHEFDALLGEGGVVSFREGRFNVLVNENAYDAVRGLNVAKGGILDAAKTTNL